MNCEDIARITDTGSIVNLSATERSAAESHARSCRECAPAWGVQSHLAGLRVPATPPELKAQLRTLAASPERAARGHSWRRLTVVGAVVALAAAAGAWMWQRTDSRAPEHASLVAAVPVAAAVPEPATGPVAVLAQAVPQPQSESLTASSAALPLVPYPVFPAPDSQKLLSILQKAVERHPDLVTGPELDDPAQFVVDVVLRTDGTVLNSAAELASSAAELASPGTTSEIINRLARILPRDGGESLSSSFQKGLQLRDGRALRGRVFMQAVMLPNTYDVARSEMRVREILGHKYDNAMLPSTSDEYMMLTVFLSEDGRILQEKVDHITPLNAAMVLGAGSGARQEEAIAGKLGISVEQIGLMGGTELEIGDRRGWMDQNGLIRLEGENRKLQVQFAWARRSEETAAFRAPVRSAPQGEIDMAAALAVVKRVLPDAFTPANSSVAIPRLRQIVVFTARGEVIRAGRMEMRNGVPLDTLLQEQLGIGVHVGMFRSIKLTDKTGATALVEFGWAN